jgi:hypothetical protein
MSNNTQSLDLSEIKQSKDTKIYNQEEITFSLFETCTESKKIKDITINEYLKLISAPKFKHKFTDLRALPEAEYKTSKASILQAITGSCIMNPDGRKYEHIEALNGLCVADFDELPDSFNNWEEFKEALSKDAYSFILHYSASARGLCMFLKIPIENDFQEIYLSMESYFKETYGAKLDLLDDKTRLRFISFDEDYIFNPDSLIYTDTQKAVLIKVKPFKKENININGEKPAEAFNKSGEQGLSLINQELSSRGYIISEGRGKTVYNYQRDVKANPKSLVAFYNKEVVLFRVHSKNAGFLKEAYNLYELYKELNSYSDFEAVKKLNDLGFGYFFEKKENQNFSSPEIEIKANEFPISALPPLFKDYADDLKNSLNFPIDYTAISFLTAVSTAIGTNISLRVKENWFEFPSLYTCLVGNPGANKTHPINLTFKPLKEKDKERQEVFEEEYKEFKKYENLSKKNKNEILEVREPKLKKSILNNFTTEILYKRLQQNERGCAVVSDELISFFEGMNNYSKTDQIGIYLSFWSNQSTTIDRVSTPIPLFILEPYLSIIGGLQPNSLSKAFPTDKINNGFLQRFLFAYPDEAIKHPINNNSPNNILKEGYDGFISKCYNKKSKTILKWNPEAKIYFYNWQKNNCDLVNDNENTVKGEIYSKFDNHFLRLAILLQIMKDVSSTEIEMEAVKGADLLCNYFVNCAFKVIAKIHSPKEYFASLPKNKKQLYETLKQNFTTAEAIEIGESFDIKERRVKEFLKDSFLFLRLKHGEYNKTI